MDSSHTFDLNQELINIQNKDEYLIPNSFSIEHLSAKDAKIKFDDIIDRIEADPTSITNSHTFDTIRVFIKSFAILQNSHASKIFDILTSGLRNLYDIVSNDISNNNVQNFESGRTALEMYMFLLHWLLIEAQNKASSDQQAEKAAALSKTKARGRGAKTKKDDSDDWDWESYRKQSLKIMADYVHLKLSKIFPSGNDRDLLISLFTKPLYHLLKNGEKTVLKCSESKSSIFNILASCVSHYNHGFSAQTSIIQNLQYFEFLSEPMAEFLHELHQREHSQLTDDILREIGKRSIGKDDTAMAKSVSKFIVKLSMLCPHDVLRQMVYLQSHLDSESYIMRAAMIETIGNLICLYIKQEMSDASKVQLQTFLAILEERFRDSHTQCRKKVLQVCYDVCESGVLTLKKRKKFLKMTISRLQDKNQPVRATAVKLVRQYLEIHPFKLHAGSLGSNFLQSNLQAIMDELKELRSKLPDVFQTAEPQQAEEDDDEEEIMAKAEPTAATEIQDSANIGASPEDLQHQQRISEAIMTLEVKRRYYEDALDFVEQMNHAAPILCQLLASRNKGEVTDAMDFFVAANAFKLDCAEVGIKKMIHLIWSKDVGSADGSSIKDHLMDCFQLLFLSADKSLNPKERISLIVKNLISLTYNTTLAELTSLQQLFHTMMMKGYFEEDVIRKLWTIYGAPNRDIPKQQRRGAILIIGWLASASPDVVKDKLDILLKVGCGSFGKDDLVLAKYSCLAIQQLTSGHDKAQTKNTRLGNDMLVFSKLTELLLESQSSVEWFGMAEQTINTMYLLAEHPDGLCTEIIKQLSRKVLDINPDCPVSSLSLNLNAEMPQSQGLSQQPSQPDGNLSQIRAPSMEECMADPLEVSKLLFVVGHVAIKQIVHLELIEAEYKRTKGQSKGLTTSSKNASSSDDLDQVVGSVEDDFADAIATVRERELLYGEKSLLAVFGPIITHICANNRFYSNRNLQNSAVLALCKFMCVSSTYCEKHLPLLFNILAKSNEPIIRSNIIIAIGDMAVCFNTLIDQNISFLYDRLNDADNAVKKNALMVLTHLILNGMVKVKGQLSEMAKCVESSDQRISDLAKLFFTELATKDNAIYNNLPDIISNLTSSERPIEEETFHKIMKFLFNFITKERQTENIIEKLCLRFKESNDPRQWRDIAYCLTLLPYSMEKADDSGEMRTLASTGANRTERNVKKLAEGLVYYSDKLHEDTVYKHIKDILQKASKIGKTEIKQFIEEFDAKIEASRVQCQNNINAEQEAVAAAKTPAPKHKSSPNVSPMADKDINIDEAVEALGALSLMNKSPTIDGTSRLSNLKRQSAKSNVPSARNSQVRARISKPSTNPSTKENIEMINTPKQKIEEPGAAKVSSTRLALRTSSRSNVSLLRKPKEPLGQKSADSENTFAAKSVPPRRRNLRRIADENDE